MSVSGWRASSRKADVFASQACRAYASTLAKVVLVLRQRLPLRLREEPNQYQTDGEQRAEQRDREPEIAGPRLQIARQPQDRGRQQPPAVEADASPGRPQVVREQLREV